MSNSRRNLICGVAVLACSMMTLSSVDAATFGITNDTFIDSGSPGTPSESNPGFEIDGNPDSTPTDAYSYGDDGKVKATTSSYSTAYPFFTATHVLFTLPASFWATIGTGPVQSAVVSYYPYNDSLNTSNGYGHDNLELHPLTQAFSTGNGQQSNSGGSLQPSTTTPGGATWESTDGLTADAWAAPGGTFDSTDVLASVTDTTLPVTKPAGSPSAPFTWNITSLINNPTTRSELLLYGALIRVTNESSLPPTSSASTAVNDFVSFYSADEQSAGTNTAGKDVAGAYVPTVSVTVPEPVGLTVLGTAGLLTVCRRRRNSKRCS